MFILCPIKGSVWLLFELCVDILIYDSTWHMASIWGRVVEGVGLESLEGQNTLIKQQVEQSAGNKWRANAG